ncbi:MAG: amidohydrolase family protein [Reyranella sp.]|uniref:amidohydrolase family protein n=1 Tax=Reyranella sp. TaxID=1929291 RepID=UPI001ACD5826|nr:amidohydrolase family protein [Reyranella sp.]MBN9089395.1 amidohydrolase family protein [Reyranella sp.]
MGLLSDEELEQLVPAHEVDSGTPIPTRLVSSDEYLPIPQTARQKQVEARMNALGDEYGRCNGLSRRRFFQTAAGMTAAFAAMNEVYGPLFGVSQAEAKSVDLAQARADGLKDQFIMDVHTHFLRDDTRLAGFARMRETVGKAGWNPELVGKPQTVDDLKYPNWFKEIYLDSDTKVALISGAPSEDTRDWFLTNDMKLDARTRVNNAAGSRRCLSHAIFTPGYDGWMDEVDRAIATLKPDSWKGYTVGDNTNKELSKHPWRMDDEKLVYPFYEKIVKAGYDIVCVHKGLYPPSVEQRFPHLTPYANVDDVGKAAKDWPQIRFVIYHSAYRWVGGKPEDAWAEFERTGRIAWTSDLADIPAKYGVSNVYGDLGQLFAMTAVVEPRLCAALMGTLIKGLGTDHVVWGTDALWTGAPQWQIEGLRRLEIPEEMRKKYGYAELGPADGPVKQAIFGGNSAKMYRYDVKKAAWRDDRFAAIKSQYERSGRDPSNLRYSYVLPG